MKVIYRGFEGELIIDLDSGTYQVSGHHPNGNVATSEVAAWRGHPMNLPTLFYEFKKSVDMCIDEGRG